MPEFDLRFSKEQIASRIEVLAAQIDRDYAGKNLILLVVLKGSLHFASDLARKMKLDPPIDFIQLASYHDDTKSSGIVQLKKDHDMTIEDRDVLIVEDIVDTGLTLEYLRELLEARRPASVSCVSLLAKPDAHQREVALEYVGFDIKNEFVVGYGLDHAEKYRSLPFIAVLRNPV
jgi:hypoxanthine phosphoribosyltransferase